MPLPVSPLGIRTKRVTIDARKLRHTHSLSLVKKTFSMPWGLKMNVCLSNRKNSFRCSSAITLKPPNGPYFLIASPKTQCIFAEETHTNWFTRWLRVVTVEMPKYFWPNKTPLKVIAAVVEWLLLVKVKEWLLNCLKGMLDCSIRKQNVSSFRLGLIKGCSSSIIYYFLISKSQFNESDVLNREVQLSTSTSTFNASFNHCIKPRANSPILILIS